MKTLLCIVMSLGVAASMAGCGVHDNKTNDLSGNNPLLDMAIGANADLTGTPPKDFSFTDDIGSTVGIACGATACPASAGYVCCTNTQGKTGTCTQGAVSTCGTAAFECDGPEDCPPATPYCCVANGYGQCVSNACPGTNEGGYGMCHLNSDCTKVGGTCCPSSMGGPYRLCLPNGCM
jgi:hypothetical protein